MNKPFKVALCFLLLAVMCLSFAACSNSKDISNADKISVTGSNVESWMFEVTNDALVNEVVEVVNSLEYEETDEAIDMMIGNGVLNLTFKKGDKKLSQYIVDCNNVLSFGDKKCYKITSDFDFYALRDTLKGDAVTLTDTASIDQK